MGLRGKGSKHWVPFLQLGYVGWEVWEDGSIHLWRLFQAPLLFSYSHGFFHLQPLPASLRAGVWAFRRLNPVPRRDVRKPGQG